MRIFVDIQHKLSTYQVLCYKLECLGWLIAPNARPDNINWVKLTNGLGRFFILDVERKELTWKGGEDYDGEGNEDVIDTPESACGLVDFIGENVDFLKDVKPKPEPKQWQSEYMASWDPYQNPYIQEQMAMKKAMEFSKQAHAAHVTATQLAKMGAYYNDPPYPNPYQMPPEKLSKVEAMIQELMKKNLTEILTVKHNTTSYQDWLDAAGKPGIPTELMYSEYKHKYTPKV